MLKIVQSGLESSGAYFGSNSDPMGDLPFKHGAIRLDLYIDPALVVLVGFQAATDQNFPDSGSTLMGLYYRIKDCNSVPMCGPLSTLLAVEVGRVILPHSQVVYTHTFSLASGASCIKLEPMTKMATHDYPATSDIQPVVTPTTSGSFIEWSLVVTKIGAIPGDTKVTFTFHLGLAYYDAAESIHVLELTFDCNRASLSWLSSAEITRNKSLGDASTTHEVCPTFAYSESNLNCWNFTPSISPISNPGSQSWFA